MALSNAERQKRFREKLKVAARAHRAAPAVSVPVALKQMFVADPEWPAGSDMDEVIATTIDGMAERRSGNTGLRPSNLVDFENFSEAAPVVTTFGGASYVTAVDTWMDAVRTWSKSRKRDKGSCPKPPAP